MKLALPWRAGALPALAGSAPAAPQRLRALLLLGCAASVALALVVARAATPAASIDDDLLQLMRSMAVVKVCIALFALAAVRWRFGRPVSPRLAVVYLAGVWLLSAGPAFIWHLAWIPATAIAFHLGELALLVAAWRDDGIARWPRSRAPGAAPPIP